MRSLVDHGVHRRWKGLKVGGAEVPVVVAEVDPRCRGLGAVPPDAYKGIIPCNSKVAPKQIKTKPQDLRDVIVFLKWGY